MSPPLRVSVVIPTLNESTTIVDSLARMVGQGADEVVVVDAASPDGTAALARSVGARVVDAPRGRGIQQNRGAAATSGDVLLFLHADCWLEPGAVGVLRLFVRDHPKVPGGCFRSRVQAEVPMFRAIDSAAHFRAGVLGVPYGDQAIFATRRAFERVGGFPEIPLMEDVFFSLRLRRLGRLGLLPSRVHVSPRRWHHQGLVRQTVRTGFLTASAAVGVPTPILARLYPLVR